MAHNDQPDASATVNRPNRSHQSTPAEYKIFPEKRLVWVKFGKRVSVREIAHYASGLRSHPVFRPGFSEIVDLREVEDLDLHGKHMLKLADEVDPFSYDSKRAFIVRNSTQSHAARMHKILRTAKENIRIFHSDADAMQWIERCTADQPRQHS